MRRGRKRGYMKETILISISDEKCPNICDGNGTLWKIDKNRQSQVSKLPTKRRTTMTQEYRNIMQFSNNMLIC